MNEAYGVAGYGTSEKRYKRAECHAVFTRLVDKIQSDPPAHPTSTSLACIQFPYTQFLVFSFSDQTIHIVPAARLTSMDISTFEHQESCVIVNLRVRFSSDWKTWRLSADPSGYLEVFHPALNVKVHLQLCMFNMEA